MFACVCVCVCYYISFVMASSRSLDGPSLVPKNYGYRKLREWEESSMTSSSSSLASARLTPGKAISVEDFKKALLPNLLSKSLPGKGQAEQLANEAASVAGSEDPSENVKSRKARSENLHMRDLGQKIEVCKNSIYILYYTVEPCIVDTLGPTKSVQIIKVS